MISIVEIETKGNRIVNMHIDENGENETDKNYLYCRIFALDIRCSDDYCAIAPFRLIKSCRKIISIYMIRPFLDVANVKCIDFVVFSSCWFSFEALHLYNQMQISLNIHLIYDNSYILKCHSISTDQQPIDLKLIRLAVVWLCFARNAEW